MESKHLNAAAPQMYEACKEALELLNVMVEARENWTKPLVFEHLRQAISKAEGK